MSFSSPNPEPEDEDSLEHTLLVVREVSVFKIPPRTTSTGYKCGEWLQSDKIWTGRLRVVSCTSRCEIRLEDPNTGELFAACYVNVGQREKAVEACLDSSRYFVVRVEDGNGKYAFVGLGFGERNEAFDFNVALSDHEKYVKREGEKEGEGGESSEESRIGIHPAVNHRLKEGETIRITVKNKPANGAGMLSSAGLSGGAAGTEKLKPLSLAPPPAASTKNRPAGAQKPLSLAPPPSASGKIRSPIPPPPNDPAAARMTSTSHTTSVKGNNETARRSTDAFTDFSQLEKNLPSASISGSGSTQSKTTAAGWAAF